MPLSAGEPRSWSDAARATSAPSAGKRAAANPLRRRNTGICRVSGRVEAAPARGSEVNPQASCSGSAEARWASAAATASGVHQPGYSGTVMSTGSTTHGGASTEEPGGARREALLPRRSVLLRSVALPVALGSLTIGSDDPTTLLNSVLAGYGLPKLPGSTGFKLLDDFELDFTLEYPRSWVVRPNTLRQGVYISDFNTADKLSVEVFPLSPESDLVTAAVTAAVVPGAGAGQQDDKLLLPPASRVKSGTELVDGKEYTYLEFPSETVTRSGYQIRRKNFAVAVVKRGTVYTLNASSRSDQFNADKEALLRHVVESFRVR